MTRRVWAVGCLLALVVIYLVCPFRLGIVCGASMEPTYHNGQAILVDRNYYRRHPVTRGDVVLLRQDGHTLIKRVFAIAGDSFHVLVCPDEEGVNRYIVDDEEIPRLRKVFRYAAVGRQVARRELPRESAQLAEHRRARRDRRKDGWKRDGAGGSIDDQTERPPVVPHQRERGLRPALSGCAEAAKHAAADISAQDRLGDASRIHAR